MGQVVLKGINKFYDSVHAVKDVNLQIRDKEFVVFVGPSGCGKTTTLRMIAGLEVISSGNISIDGQVVNDLAPMDRDIAMVFQNYALYPHMSVFDNMAFGLKMRKFAKAEIRKRVNEAADILGSPARNFATVTMFDGNGRITAKNGGLEIEVPGPHADRLRGHVGRQLTMGIRPENLHVASAADPEALTFNSKVEVVEKLGSEILLDVRVGDDTMVAAVDP